MLAQIRREFDKIWSPLSTRQRIAILGVTGAALLFMIIFALWASAPSYQVLFDNLSTQDAASVVTQLKTSKIPYQLSGSGTTILVPTDQLANARLDMAGLNLGQNGQSAGVGYDLLDKMTILDRTDFKEQVDYTRALEGELESTLEAINGVDVAHVSLVIPPTNVFTTQQDPTTASILLKLAAGASLSDGQVSGIQHLVASSIQGLKPDNVTITDDSGNILSLPPSTAGGLSASQGTAQEDVYAQDVQNKISSMLDGILGSGHAVVRVSDTMNWNSVDTTANLYSPPGSSAPQIAASHDISNTTYNGTTAGGVPGTSKVLPSYTGAVSSTNGTANAAVDSTHQYDVSEIVSHTILAPGTVSHLSIAVVLDQSVVSPTQLASLSQSISDTAGLLASRGDNLSVTMLPFNQSAMLAAQKQASLQQQQALLTNIAKWASIVIFPLLLFFLFRRSFLPQSMEESPELSEARRVLALAQEQRLGLEGDQPLLLPEPSPEDRRRTAIEESIVDLARTKPEIVAQLIQGWLDEDEAQGA